MGGGVGGDRESSEGLGKDRKKSVEKFSERLRWPTGGGGECHPPPNHIKHSTV